MKKKNIFEGYLNIARNHTPVLWSIPFDNRRDHYEFPKDLILKYHLVSGARVKCGIEDGKINKIISVCDLKPEKFATRAEFSKLLPLNPTEKFDFGSSESVSIRILDLIVPIGKGTRGLIVSPPRAGKTMLLEAIANDLHRIDSNLKVIILLIDERPEEVTSFIMNTKAHVFHSSLDKGTTSHIVLSSFLINHVRTEVECGNNVVILIDSLTRMGRAYNISDRNSNNRIMSGGLSAGALELPRKLFGIARNIENGGSCTIIATILKDTGSRMDEVIFQEFKGTGNCEIILDREIAEKRVFPAINITESGTRKEELLHSPEEIDKINAIRRDLMQIDKVAAISKIKQMIDQYKSNHELLKEY
ncbi:MAG: transcription termination factor Rho [Candidatus Cloacimonetes bacterium]|nr:transcription termination factor Rho [Candidatus Cloacimonadota bacterium]